MLEPICEGVKGCKTGITQAAGPCFSGYFERKLLLENDSETLEHVIIIVLNSKTMEARWVEIPELLNWFLSVKEQAIEDAENPKGLHGHTQSSNKK